MSCSASLSATRASRHGQAVCGYGRGCDRDAGLRLFAPDCDAEKANKAECSEQEAPAASGGFLLALRRFVELLHTALAAAGRHGGSAQRKRPVEASEGPPRGDCR